MIRIACILALLAACSGPGEQPGTPSTPANGDVGSQPAQTDTTLAPDISAKPELPAFWIAYEAYSQLDSATSQLILVDAHSPKAITDSANFGTGHSPFEASESCFELSKHAFDKAPGMSCDHGCALSSNLKYAAIALGPADEDGLFTYEPALIHHQPGGDPPLRFIINKFDKITAVRDLHFAGSWLYYSTPVPKPAGQLVQQYEIRRRDLDGASSEWQKVVVMAPGEDPDVTGKHSTYSGRFRVSANGETLLFLTPTIRSLKVWSWHAGTLTQHDYICQNPLGPDTCAGTGSQYSDIDPAAISPDGKTIVLFTTVQSHFRLRRYPVGSAGQKSFTNLVTVPANKNYQKEACNYVAAWMRTSVRGQPRFSNDGQTLYFLAESRCNKAVQKPWIDILSIHAADIGKTLTEEMVTNYTKNPDSDLPANRVMRSFDLSPDGEWFTYSATPTWNSQGNAIAPGSPAAQLKDSELYVMPVEIEGKANQITNRLGYRAAGPMALSPL